MFFSPPDPNAEQSGAATSDGRGTELGAPQDLSSALTAALPHVKALESQLMAALPPLLPPSLLVQPLWLNAFFSRVVHSLTSLCPLKVVSFPLFNCL